MTSRLSAALLLVAIAGCDGGDAKPRPGGVSMAELLEVYEYDPDAPLPFRFDDEAAAPGEPGSICVRFTFRTWEREPVPGLIALPTTGTAPFPTIVYFHRIVEDETAALAVRDALKELGVAVLSVRLPVKRQSDAGGDAAREKRMQSFRNRRMAVLEARSALDAAVARGIADPRRVAAAGASAGGGPAVVFAAVEPRARAVAALSTGAAEYARSIPERASKIDEEARRTVASVDPVEFAPLVSPRPFLLVRGELDDEVSDESARALLAAARGPKRYVTIPSEGHRIALASVAPVLVEFFGESIAPKR
jgi:dienelactone hydrolase